MSAVGSGRHVTFRDVLANPEFRALFLAQALSVVGDQLAKIAVALLVYSRSSSALLAAATYAVTYLPWLVGGPWLSVYADRLPRRQVLIACDLARFLLVLPLAWRALPTGVALLVVAVVSAFQPLFNASRSALVADILEDPDAYATGAALSATTDQLGQVAGFALGGILVAAISSTGAIVTDSASFLVSALLVARGVHRRPAPPPLDAAGTAGDGRDEGHGSGDRGRRADALAFVRRTLPVRDAVLSAYAVVAATIAPESVAVPYSAAHGGGATTAGLLTAAVPLGTVAGALALSRLVGQRRAERYMPQLAFLTAGSLALTAFDPPVAVTFVLWVIAGAGSAMVITSSSFVARLTAPSMRGRVFGLLGTGLAVVQGAAALVTGAVAQSVGPATAVADLALPALAVLIVIASRRYARATSSLASRAPTYETDQQPDEEPVNQSLRRPEPRMWVAVGVLATAAALLALPQWHAGPPVRVDLPVWWFLLLFLIVEAYPLQFEFRRTTRHVLLDSVAMVLGLFFLSPLNLIAARFVAKAVSTAAQRKNLLRVAFNATNGAFTIAAALTLFRAALPDHPSVHHSVWPAVVMAIVIDDVLAAGVVSYPGYVYNRSIRLRTLWPPLAFSLGVNLVNTCLGLVTASAISYDAANAWIIAVFLVLTLAGFRTYHRLADRHAALDRLYTLAKDLGPITSDPADLGPAILALRELLRAPTLEMSLLREGDLALVVTAVDDGIQGRVQVREEPLSADRLALLEPERSAPRRRRLTRRRRSVALSPESMSMPVGVADETLGMLRAWTTMKTGREFDRNDLRLLAAVADQLGTALEKGRLIENLRQAASRDSLTGLANLDTLRSFLATMLAEQTGCVVLLLDIDRFHDINDTLGHDSGDAVLIEVARRLEDAATQGSLACRVGGDQFALVIPGQSNSDLARLAALAVKSRVDGSLRLDDVAADLRLTIGMARAPEHGDDAPTILRRAEIAMGTAKGSSHGIAEWEPQMERDGSRRLYVLSGLRQALVDSDLTVEFQPKLLLGTGEVTGFEALVRWRHAELGLVSPAEFIPLAEATGLVGALTSTVLRLALSACRRWHDEGYPVGVAVNISARSLDDPVLVGQVAALLTASGLDGTALTLEITESSVMENPVRSVEVLRQLRSLGIRLSIDDFGTGYSSLHQLRGLPVHEVKIDKTFVDNIDRDGADRAVVRAVVELCDSLGLVTVAEGVEQPAQAYALDALGVRQVQGYFYGRPMPEPEAIAWMRKRPIAARAAVDESDGERQRG